MTVGLARTLAVPDSGIADDSSTSSTLSKEIKSKRFLSPGGLLSAKKVSVQDFSYSISAESSERTNNELPTLTCL